MTDRSIINGSKHARPRGSHQRGESTGLNIVINSSSVIIIMKDDDDDDDDESTAISSKSSERLDKRSLLSVFAL